MAPPAPHFRTENALPGRRLIKWPLLLRPVQLPHFATHTLSGACMQDPPRQPQQPRRWMGRLETLLEASLASASSKFLYAASHLSSRQSIGCIHTHM